MALSHLWHLATEVYRRMTNRELMYLKAKLLCYGVSADSVTKSYMTTINPYVLEKGFIHAAHFQIDEMIINTCIEEKFCLSSPFSIELREGVLALMENGNFICEINVLRLPDWCRKTVDIYCIGKYLRPHSSQCISFWPYLQCDYYRQGKQCKFCSMGEYASNNALPAPVLPISIAREMIQTALQFNPNYELALSGGTCCNPDSSVRYYAEICEQAQICGANYISVETAPPRDLCCIQQLRQHGATAIIMNMEIADENLRRDICPGKSFIPKEHYLHAYEKAVNAFGAGNVSCVLIAGLQKAESIIHMAETLIEIGVIPTIIPFKPLDKCDLSDYPTTNPKEVILIATEVERLLQRYGMVAKLQRGCTKCNGCSLETIAAQI